ncbi:MAG: DUF3332 domain-containing protein [Marinifilaceae bacterium]
MKRKFNQLVAVTLLAASSVTMSGCFGSFALTTKLHDWNSSVSNHKFVNELVFLGMCILPAYELCVLGDAIIFNSIEFWGGNNPIAMKAGEVETETIKHRGQMYAMTKTQNNVVITHADTQSSVNFRYFPEEKSWYQMDGSSKVKVVEMKKNKVFTYLPNNKTLVFEAKDANIISEEVMAAM